MILSFHFVILRPDKLTTIKLHNEINQISLDAANHYGSMFR